VTITKRQLAVFEVVSRALQAWVLLIAIIVILAVGVAAFLYALFRVDGDYVPKLLLGGIDLLIGKVLLGVQQHLFPKPKE